MLGEKGICEAAVVQTLSMPLISPGILIRQSHVDPSLEPSMSNDTQYAKYLNTLKF